MKGLEGNAIKTNNMKTTYTFGELSKEAQKVVIEGHTEYLNQRHNRQHNYLEVTDDLTKNNYNYDEGGNVVTPIHYWVGS